MDRYLHYLAVSFAAFVLALALTPLMILVSRRLKILDMPGTRKAHQSPMPLMGGVAIYLATILATILFILFFGQSLRLNIVFAFLIGISGVTMMGLIDDILSLSAKRRLVILFILALIVLVGCLQFYFPEAALHTDLLTTLLTSFIVVFWIVAVTNAINFADGLDGLASCLSLVSAASFAVIFFLQGRWLLALPTSLALCGAIAGFLPYNLNPAKIFMGDAGSMFIGFMLGIFSIMSMSQRTWLFFVVPAFLILVPIADMSMSVVRRLILHSPVMQPDRMHFHHILLRRLKSHRLVVLVLAAVQLFSAGIGIVIFLFDLYVPGWILLGALALAALIFSVTTARILRRQEAARTDQIVRDAAEDVQLEEAAAPRDVE